MRRFLILFSIAACIIGAGIFAIHLGSSAKRHRPAAVAKKEPVRRLMLVTAYCADKKCKKCVGVKKWRDGKTSLGDSASVLDGVAADFNLLPPRTRLWIPGVGYREVDDSGSGMRKSARETGIYHVDLRLATHKEAQNFADGKGKIWALVEVLGPIPSPPYESFEKARIAKSAR